MTERKRTKRQAIVDKTLHSENSRLANTNPIKTGRTQVLRKDKVVHVPPVAPICVLL